MTFLNYSQPGFYRFSEDSIWLAAEVLNRIHQDQKLKVCDLGAGCGIVGIELLNKGVVKKLDLIEAQAEFIPHIEKNLTLASKVEACIINSDLRDVSGKSYDLIVSNPPYFREKDSRPSQNMNREYCRKFKRGGFSDFVNFICRNLEKSGCAFILGRKESFHGQEPFDFKKYDLDLVEKIVKGKNQLFFLKRLNVD